MSMTDDLKQALIEFVNDLQTKLARNKRDREEVQARLAQIDDDSKAANLAQKRLANFQVKIGVYYQCYRCWAMDERQSNFMPLPGSAKADRFRCENCHLEFSTPA